MKKKPAKYLRILKNNILEYETNKITVIQNTKVVYLLRSLQTFILIYVIVYSMWFKRGYQDSYGLSSSIVLKMKGFGLGNKIDRKIWDVSDLVVPPQEENAIFITTNVIVTNNQTQGKCPEKPTITNAICKSDSDCFKNKAIYLGNGMMTGRCIKATNTIKTCEIHAWCPLEQSYITSQEPLIKEISNYTLLIKNTVIFDEVNIQKSNLFAWTNGIIPKSCIFNATDKLLKYCPIFNVSSFIGKMNQTDLTELYTYGGIIRIIITWDCNLDRSSDLCRPEYTFEKIFSVYTNYSKGWNFRYAYYFENNGKEYRTLFKVYGLRILIEVRGMGYKFSLFTCSMNIGSGIGLLAIATEVCDIIMTWFLPRRKQYNNIIYENYDIKNIQLKNLKMKNPKVLKNKNLSRKLPKTADIVS